MSREPEDKACEELVFECLLKLVSQRRPRIPFLVPRGLENLKEDELLVLAWLQQISGERGVVDRETPTEQREAMAEEIPEVMPEGLREGVPEGVREGAPEGVREGVREGVHGAATDNRQPSDPCQVIQESVVSNAPEGHQSESVTAQPESLAEAGKHPEQGELAKPAMESAVLPDPTDRTDAGSEASDEPETPEEKALIKGPGGIPKTGLEPTRPDPDRISLKNGRARQPYKAFIEGYSAILLQDHGGTNLTVSPEGEVSGGEIAAGEYTLILNALRAKRPVLIQARLSIIADPRDLWKEIASDQQAPNAKVDEASDHCTTSEAFIVAASKRGRSHAQEGKYRDDDFSISADTRTGWHILVVADGAGSAELSREGSRIACETITTVLAELLAEKLDPRLQDVVDSFAEDQVTWASMVREEILVSVLPESARKAALAIEERAVEMGRKPQEFSTTVVIAVSKKIAEKWFTASFSIGDGGVAIFDESKQQVTVMCQPDSGEFAGQTRFLASSEFAHTDEIKARIFVDLREDFTVLAAMTDGITDPKFPTDAAFADSRIWAEFWAEDIGKQVSLQPGSPDSGKQILSWLDFWSRGNHDDRTIALMLPVSRPIELPVSRPIDEKVAEHLVGDQLAEKIYTEQSPGQDDSIQ